MRRPEPDRNPIPAQPDRPAASSDRREEVFDRTRSYRLNADEMHLLTTVGSFRTVAIRDLSKPEITNLLRAGLMDKKSVYPQRSGLPLEVLVLTETGRKLLRHQQPLEARQRYYARLAKPNEIEHDAAIYRAYLKAKERIEEQGGTVNRIVLDYELKSIINREMNSSSGSAAEKRRSLAVDLDLKIVNDKLPLPDLRLEYTDQEGRELHEDLEIVTRHYKAAHMAGKAAAGFALVNANGARSGVIDDHHHRY